MATAIDALEQVVSAAAAPDQAKRASTPAGPDQVLKPWAEAQSINVRRHAAALRPFRNDEFGSGAAAPTAGHLEAVNNLISQLRRGLLKYSEAEGAMAQQAAR